MIYRKTEKEIEFMRLSCQIVSDVHRLLLPYVKAGVVVSELDAMAEDFIRSSGGRPAFKGYPSGNRTVSPFPSTLCVSIDDEVVHGIPDGRVIEEGQVISIDVGVEKNGYYGDGAMTVTVGKVDPETMRLLNVTKESLYCGIEQAIPGNHLQDISSAVQKHVESNGFSVVRDLVGHGIGRSLHEDPPVPNFGRAGIGPELFPGMTLAIEPMVNYGGYQVKVASNGWTIVTKDMSLSAHFEHTVLISEDGPVILTNHFERANGKAG